MRTKATNSLPGLAILPLLLLVSNLLWAQISPVTLSGAVRDTSGKAIPNARISIKNVETGKALDTETNLNGLFTAQGLTQATYIVSVSAEGFSTKATKLTLSGTTQQTLDFVLDTGPSQKENPANQASPPANLPNAPSSTTAAPSLKDLGFNPQQTQANPQLQAMLDKRSDMLRIHQKIGLITTIPMLAAVITGPQVKAKGKNGQTIKEPSSANLDIHAALGGITTGLYFTSAYYAMFAPKVPGTQKRGAIRAHEALVFVHGPGMILTPILGIMAYKQENAGEKVHGIASAHGAVAYTTAAAYGASILAVSWPIHWKFRKQQ